MHDSAVPDKIEACPDRRAIEEVELGEDVYDSAHWTKHETSGDEGSSFSAF